MTCLERCLSVFITRHSNGPLNDVTFPRAPCQSVGKGVNSAARAGGVGAGERRAGSTNENGGGCELAITAFRRVFRPCLRDDPAVGISWRRGRGFQARF